MSLLVCQLTFPFFFHFFIIKIRNLLTFDEKQKFSAGFILYRATTSGFWLVINYVCGFRAGERNGGPPSSLFDRPPPTPLAHPPQQPPPIPTRVKFIFQFWVVRLEIFNCMLCDSYTPLCWSVCPSVCPSHFTFFRFLRSLPQCSCPNDQVTSNTALAHPHATGVAVYPTLFP